MKKKSQTFSILFSIGVVLASLCATQMFAKPLNNYVPRTGSVIFIHPDGTALNHWTAARVRWKGPDGWLNWDRLPHMAIYTAHMGDALSGTSHGGGTIHAYGIKVPADSFGKYGKAPLTSLSGQPYSIIKEAQKAGISCGLINSGELYEPGTACFVASVNSRKDSEVIVKQVIESNIEVIMGGGEGWLLPEGVQGRHGAGKRKDGLNLINVARTLGYTIVYDRGELNNVAIGTKKLLGVFAHEHTFNDQSEEKLAAYGKPLYEPNAPTIAEMLSAALRVLDQPNKPFLLVAEEEGTDNFPNVYNASGALEALRRADDAIGEAQAFLARKPNTLLLTAADSDASGLQVLGGWPGSKRFESGKVAPTSDDDGTGGHMDGKDGTGTAPFMSAPDASGKKHPFAIIWSSQKDVSGGVLARAQGLNSEIMHGTIDNTDIYRLMYATLFGELLP